jgi:hypothetical protein
MTTPEIQAFQKRRLEEEISAQAPSSLDQNILGFHLEDSPRSQKNVFNKAIVDTTN